MMKNSHKPEEFKGRIVRTLTLETCGQSDHLGGCTIRFGKMRRVVDTQDRNDTLVHYDKFGKVVEIEFYNGFKKEEIRI